MYLSQVQSRQWPSGLCLPRISRVSIRCSVFLVQLAPTEVNPTFFPSVSVERRRQRRKGEASSHQDTTVLSYHLFHLSRVQRRLESIVARGTLDILLGCAGTATENPSSWSSSPGSSKLSKQQPWAFSKRSTRPSRAYSSNGTPILRRWPLRSS